MCNDCDCEFSYLCSIKGYLPFGACCKKCVSYDERDSCEKFKVKLPQIKVVSSPEYPVLPKKSIQLYP
jgi:hypothetical protein